MIVTTEEKREFIKKTSPNFFFMWTPKHEFDRIVHDLSSVSNKDRRARLLDIFDKHHDEIFIDFAYYIVTNPKSDALLRKNLVKSSVQKIVQRNRDEQSKFSNVVQRLYTERGIL